MEKSKAPIGEIVLVILEGEPATKGTYLGSDETFIYIKTHKNKIQIPLTRVIKIKSDGEVES